LPVFVGGFTLEAAEGICYQEPLSARAVLDLLGRLVDRSLVKVERQGEYERYRLLEIIGEYAREKLDESGETERLRQQHRDFFISLAEQTAPKLRSAEQFTGLDRLELEHDNLRAAWDWAIDRDDELALRLVSALLDFWIMRGNPSEGRQWLDQLLPRTDRWGQTAQHAHALGLAGRLAYFQRDFSLVQKHSEESLAIARRAGDKKGIAFALWWLGRTALRHREVQTAQGFTEESLTLYQELQDPWAIALAIYQLADLAAMQGRYAEAEERYMESLSRFQALGDKFRMGYIFNSLESSPGFEKITSERADFTSEHINILRQQRSPGALVLPSVNYAWVSLHRVRYCKAKELFEETLKLSNEFGNKTAMADCLADWREF
jgi:tetratricopeptide (TPR) repeat protein